MLFVKDLVSLLLTPKADESLVLQGILPQKQGNWDISSLSKLKYQVERKPSSFCKQLFSTLQVFMLSSFQS